MGERLRYTQPSQLGQLSLASHPESLKRVPALIGGDKGGNVTSAGWQVTLCKSRSGEACCKLLYPRYFTYFDVLTG